MRLDKTVVPQGQPLTATWSISGGQPPYGVEPIWGLTAAYDGMSMYGERVDENDYASFSPSEPGYGSAQLRVQDAAGREVYSEALRFLATNAQGQQVYPELSTGFLPPPAPPAARTRSYLKMVL